MEATEIRYIAPFVTLPPAERAELASAARTRMLRHGERLFQVGDACPNVMIVLDGVVGLFRFAPDGAEVTTSLASRSAILGGTGLQGGTAHDAFAEAIGYVRVIEIPTVTLLSLASRFPKLFHEITRELIAQTDNVYLNTITEAQEQLSARLLHTLRRLTRTTRASGSDAAWRPLAHRLSHTEIARLVGANRSSVTRELGLLDDRHLIRRERGHVTAVRSL